MITLGITGGIGSGKSTVCGILETMGIPIYDSDSAAKRLYSTDDRLLDSLEEAFGCSMRTQDGTFDKAKLSSIAFSSKDSMAKIESIVHPVVLRDFIRWKAMNDANGVAVAGMESALIMNLPEFLRAIDKVIYVDAPVGIRLARTHARDKTPEIDILTRMSLQHFDLSKADAIIRNTGSMADLKRETEAALKKLNIKI